MSQPWFEIIQIFGTLVLSFAAIATLLFTLHEMRKKNSEVQALIHQLKIQNDINVARTSPLFEFASPTGVPTKSPSINIKNNAAYSWKLINLGGKAQSVIISAVKGIELHHDKLIDIPSNSLIEFNFKIIDAGDLSPFLFKMNYTNILGIPFTLTAEITPDHLIQLKQTDLSGTLNEVGFS